jgi:hypothetical protein
VGAQGFQSAAGSETRKGKRSRVLFKAIIRHRGRESEARVRDLSSLGALIEIDNPPPLGTNVLFVRGSIAAVARIAWAGGDRAGLEFEHPVNQKEMLAQPPMPAPKMPAKPIDPESLYRRPGVQFNRMTDEERRLAHVWAAQMGLTFED